MVAEILCVGTELLMGQVLNTNAQFLSRRLSALGISQYHQDVVGDNAQRLEEAYRLALSRGDYLRRPWAYGGRHYQACRRKGGGQGAGGLPGGGGNGAHPLPPVS